MFERKQGFILAGREKKREWNSRVGGSLWFFSYTLGQDGESLACGPNLSWHRFQFGMHYFSQTMTSFPTSDNICHVSYGAGRIVAGSVVQPTSPCRTPSCRTPSCRWYLQKVGLELLPISWSTLPISGTSENLLALCNCFEVLMIGQLGHPAHLSDLAC